MTFCTLIRLSKYERRRAAQPHFALGIVIQNMIAHQCILMNMTLRFHQVYCQQKEEREIFAPNRQIKHKTKNTHHSSSYSSHAQCLLHALKRDENTVKTLSASSFLGHQKEQSYSTDRNGFWSSRNILICSFLSFLSFSISHLHSHSTFPFLFSVRFSYSWTNECSEYSRFDDPT